LADPLRIKLSDVRRRDLLAAIRGFYRERFDEDIGDLKARFLLEFFLGALGPPVYNQGVKDATAFVQERLLDLEGEVYEPELDPARDRSGEGA
jgi:uncharacterized protein (DUF2164 family)